jgi:multidrug transporter EmrE-like cation transporter
MNADPPKILVKGRPLGFFILVSGQLLVGTIHVFFGLLLLTFDASSYFPSTVAYDIYTFFFGLLGLVFAGYLWQGRRVGWIGTIGLSLFVIAADSLTLLNLPSIPGIPKFPALAEIGYSVLIISYLSLRHVRENFLR